MTFNVGYGKLFIEWNTNAQRDDKSPSRGAVVAYGALSGVVWAFDDQTLMVIPIAAGRIGDIANTVSVPRNSAIVTGRITTRQIGDLRDAFASEIEIRKATAFYDSAFVYNQGENSTLTPSGRDGWQPMSKVDGLYWRRYRHPDHDGSS